MTSRSKKFLPNFFIDWIGRKRLSWQRRTYYRSLKQYREKGLQVVHFIHIPKTGGTAIKEALKNIGQTAQYKIELHGHSFHLENVPRGDKTIFFVRDPADRFVSGFWSRYREEKPRYFVPWNPDEQKIFSLYQTPNQLAEALSDKNLKMRMRARWAMKKLRHVNTRHKHWLCSAKELLKRQEDILFVGSQKHLNQDINRIQELLKISNSLSLPQDEKKSHKTPEGKNKLLSEVARENLKVWFSDDYYLIQALKEMGFLQ